METAQEKRVRRLAEKAEMEKQVELAVQEVNRRIIEQAVKDGLVQWVGKPQKKSAEASAAYLEIARPAGGVLS